MPSFHFNHNSVQNFDEQRWIIHIRRALDEHIEEEEEEANTTVSIFNVPKTLMFNNLDCYVPQQVSLGPFHHWRPELYEMEIYKLSAAKRFQKRIPSLKFQNLIDRLIEIEPKIRACYHKYLNFNGDTLAWMMAMDSCFLLEFLQIYGDKEGKVLTRVSSRMSHLVDVTGRKLAHNAILRDIVMLENQMPLFLLRKMLEFQFESKDDADNMLCAMFIGLGKELSPFKTLNELPSVQQVMECSHFLDFLYHLIVPKIEGYSEISIEDEEEETNNEIEENKSWKIISKFKMAPVSFTRKFLVSKPIQFLSKLPLKFFSSLPGVIMVKQIQYLFFSHEEFKSGDLENGNSGLSDNLINKPPLMEEIAIPSVTELSKAGVIFSSTNNGIFSIDFDEINAILYLPTIILDGNSETIMRNLVAYEACNASGPLVFTRYTELMNGIIDTEDDAKFLREKGIIFNHLKSDLDLANLWNGMSKSIRLTKVPFLDKVIEDVNKYYYGRWKVRIGNFIGRHVFGSWQSLTLMGAILMLFLMSLQVFCAMFGFGRVFHHHKRG